GSDISYVNKLRSQHKSNNAFKSDLTTSDSFSIQDTVPVCLVSIVAQSTNPLLRQLFEAKESGTKESGTKEPGTKESGKESGTKARPRKPSTISRRFKEQLNDLLRNIEQTNVLYVRCIKPNNYKSATEFSTGMVAEQVRSSGIVEAAHISRASLPHKTSSLTSVTEVHSVSQVGRTRVYLSQGVLGQLQAQRGAYIAARITLLQGLWRGFTAQRRYATLRKSLSTLQGAVRGWIRRRHSAAVVLVHAMRGWCARQGARRLLGKIDTVRRFLRGWVHYRVKRCQEDSACRIQRCLRSFVRAHAYARVLESVRMIQRFLRRRALCAGALQNSASTIQHLVRTRRAVESDLKMRTRTALEESSALKLQRFLRARKTPGAWWAGDGLERSCQFSEGAGEGEWEGAGGSEHSEAGLLPAEVRGEGAPLASYSLAPLDFQDPDLENASPTPTDPTDPYPTAEPANTEQSMLSVFVTVWTLSLGTKHSERGGVTSKGGAYKQEGPVPSAELAVEDLFAEKCRKSGLRLRRSLSDREKMGALVSVMLAASLVLVLCHMEKC
ncbi:P-loop containing nucleoside triphosphate hydrolase protein, partial [Ochromonadaceae sp. CCMP2298]